MKRRQFLQNSGVLAGGLLLRSQVLNAQDNSKLTVGVIGCGDRGNGLLEVMQQLPDLFTIKAICDVLDFRIEASKKKLTSPADVHKDYRKLLDDKHIDAVIIATPLNMHYEIAVAALNAGKHVFLEKTMTYNIPQALDLVA